MNNDLRWTMLMMLRYDTPDSMLHLDDSVDAKHGNAYGLTANFLSGISHDLTVLTPLLELCTRVFAVSATVLLMLEEYVAYVPR